ncbi:MAG: DegV family protein [Trueperaceae bacterium]
MLLGVVTDSTCDLPAATLNRLRVEAVPLRLEVGEEVYLDWRDIDPATLYDWMQHQGVVPSVRSPEPEDFMHVYRRLLQRYDQIVSIHLSPQFSRTFEHARRAARRLGVEEKITFIDSGFAGPGLAEIVLEVARLSRQGGSAIDMQLAAAGIRKNLYGVVSPTNGDWSGELDWLSALRDRRHRALGHRRLVAMESGEMTQLGWERESRVANALAAALRKRFGNRTLLVAIAYGGADQEALARLRSAMEEAGLRIVHGRLQLIGPALGARLGPGSAMVFARPAPDR